MSRTSTGILITNGPPTAIVCYHKDRWKLTIVDCQNYLDAAPDKVASLVGVPHHDWPDPDSPNEEWESVLTERVTATKELFVRLVCWQNAQELGMFSLTVSSLAMAAFRHRFMRHRIELPETQDERDWERVGYFNGRVEALWCGTMRDGVYYPLRAANSNPILFEDQPQGPYHAVDARSFYAAIQTYEQLPYRCVESHMGIECKGPPIDESLCEVMASITLCSHDTRYPVRTSGGGMFATGEYNTTLCGPELARAAYAGHIRQWHSWRRYALGPVLRWYAEGLWGERVKAEGRDDRLTAALCKSLMARIHGKFLQRAHRWTLLPGRLAPGPWEHWTGIDAVSGRVRRFRSVGWDVQIRDDAGDAEHCFPALAAWVTSHGREYLRHWMTVAGKQQVLYVGCDGMIVTDVGLHNLTRAGIVWPDGVGSLRIVRSAPDIEIRGPNNYRHGDHECVSGRSFNGLRVIDREWHAQRWQGLEETFLATDKSIVNSYAVHGRVDGYSQPGRVGPGGWIEPPTLSLRSQELCQSSE